MTVKVLLELLVGIVDVKLLEIVGLQKEEIMNLMTKQ